VDESPRALQELRDAFTVKVVARDGKRAVFTLQLSDLKEFTKIVKEELKVKLDCTSE
jgi:hypothetical protein